MKNRFRVAVWLFKTFENEITCGLKRDAVVKVGSHVLVLIVFSVLFVDNRSHALHGFADLRFRHHPMVQPIRNVLTGNPTGRAVFPSSRCC